MIREANIEDVDQIAQIILDSWKITYKGIIPSDYLDNMSISHKKDKWTKMINESKKSKTFVYEENETIQGVIRIGEVEEIIDNNTGEVYALYVNINKKRKGIGSKLFDYAKNEFIKMGHNNVILWCAKDNIDSIEFYKKMGGKIIKERILELDNVKVPEVAIVYNFKNEIKTNSHIADFQKIPYYPISFKYGNGALLYDYDGKEYIDFLASASSANVGHGNEEIANAVFNQMKKITQYASVYFPMPEEEVLSEKLINLTGEGNMQVAFSNSGSEAIDCAIKLAKAYTKRNKIISFKEAYHGGTYGASSISAISLNMRKNIGGLIPEIYHISYPNCYRCKYSKENECNNFYCLTELTDAFEQYIPPNDVAAIFMEPIAGDMGIVVPPKEYMQKLYELCKKHGILLVFDEIQQGMCRTGKWFSFENFGIKPDIIVLGKTVGGGLPLGVTIAKKEIMNSLSAPAHVFTMSGNSTVCVAALKQIEIFERENINEQVEEKGDYLKNKLQKLMEKYEIIGQIRGIGLSIGMEIVDNRKDKNKNTVATAKISYNCIENGLLLTFIGKNTLRIQPPLVITKEQIDKAIQIMDNAFQNYINNKIDDKVLQYAKGW